MWILSLVAAHVALTAALSGQGPKADVPTSASMATAGAVAAGVLRVERGAVHLPLLVPQGEKLHFDVELSVGPIRGADVGSLELTTGVEAYRSGLPLPGQSVADEGRSGWLRSLAKGGSLGYSVEHEYVSRHLPSAWPRVIFRDAQSGSENRRRELKIGERDGEHVAVYRSDGHCKGCERREHVVAGAFPWQGEEHCSKCKRGEHRVWRDPVSRALPADAVDMLSAVYLARSLLLSGEQKVSIPLIDKTRLWDVSLERGERAVVETHAGSFDAYRMVFVAKLFPGEEESDSEFEGLFGIRGSINIWVHAVTGVPVLITGVVPVGPLKLDARVTLATFQGTPPAFGPLAR